MLKWSNRTPWSPVGGETLLEVLLLMSSPSSYRIVLGSCSRIGCDERARVDGESSFEDVDKTSRTLLTTHELRRCRGVDEFVGAVALDMLGSGVGTMQHQVYFRLDAG
ncbi:unnamed protein product [Phytophthora lilii]|uniref:Unnamed protein product n=1 Tax=Phytophthora lilii TaxID=2077276 RepID=A0A9W6X8L8_9STRA|nr:unnamed protein product [Phytophthora lilii]